MKCPACQRRLRIGATDCLCGWGKPSTALHNADAAARYEEFKRKETDREQRQHDEAQTFMRQHGLKNVADCVDLARRTLKGIECTRSDPAAHWRKVLANPKASIVAIEFAREAIAKLEAPIVDREPGSDDEETPA